MYENITHSFVRVPARWLREHAPERIADRGASQDSCDAIGQRQGSHTLSMPAFQRRPAGADGGRSLGLDCAAGLGAVTFRPPSSLRWTDQPTVLTYRCSTAKTYWNAGFRGEVRTAFADALQNGNFTRQY